MKEELFYEIGESITESIRGNLFGKPCFKYKTKAFICFFEYCMVFKLSGKAHQDAMALEGSKHFDPSGKGRPMKEWVQVTFDHSELWTFYANEAKKYAILLRKTRQ